MGVLRNFTHAIRALRQAPGFSAVVVLILALGIGANTAIFTLLDAALLRPLPYRNPSSLVLVSLADRTAGNETGPMSYPLFTLIAARTRTFVGIAAFTNETFNFTSGDEAMQVQAARVSANFFDVLGVKPALGRSFLSEEGKPGGKLVAILSDAFWRRAMHSNPRITGGTITLDANVYAVVGVLPPSFSFAPLGTTTEVWTTHIDQLNLTTPEHIQAGAGYLDGIARTGSSLAQSQAEMNVLHQQYLREFPKLADADPKRPVEVTPLRTKLVSSFRSLFVMLSASVGLVLLIACANAAGLLLARGLKRSREIAIRIAIGATRKQVIAQLLAESLMLAILSGLAGFALSLAGANALAHFTAQQVPRVADHPTALDWRILAFAAAVSIATGLLFGFAPALQLSKPQVSSALREEGRGVAGSRTRSLSRNLLASGQIALSLVLLLAAGLLIRSFVRLTMQPPGFDPQRVLTMNLTLPPSKYSTPAQMIDFYDRLLSRVRAVPGVQAAAVSSALPLDISRLTPALIEGQPPLPLPQRPIIVVQTFTPSYLAVMKIPLIRGRFFNPFDKRDTARVVVVNHAFAARYFPDRDAIGKHIWLGKMTAPAEITGVIGDIKNLSLSAGTEPEIDVPFPQLAWARMNLLVRATGGDPKALTGAIRLQIAKTDRDQPATAIQTMSELLAAAGSQAQAITLLLAAFAAFAFLLAIVGLYGVISYSVAQRTQELGVRMALGATRHDLLRLVLRQGARLAFAGVFVGVAGALAVNRMMTNLVYGVSTTDPLTFIVIPLLFLLLALVATYVPAVRAARVDVADALRLQ
jgi:putative ABC transport system permease protein